MFILEIWRDVFEKSGIWGVVILAGYIAIAVGACSWLLWSIAAAAFRWFHRRRVCRELRVLRGGRDVFTSYGELRKKPAKPPVRSLRRRRGEDDAA